MSRCGLCFQIFSNCSKRSIVKRLRSKAPLCFRKRNVNVCGNSRVERGEDCDPGLLHINSDHCCTPECRLRAGAQCRSESVPTFWFWAQAVGALMLFKALADTDFMNILHGANH